MSFNIKSTNKDDEDLGNRRLLQDIKEISQALYLHKSLPKAINSSFAHCPSVAAKAGNLASRTKTNIQDSFHEGRKPSRWSWKPLKTLAHARDHRFNCCFFLEVHSIEGLPSPFNDLSMYVTWKRKAKMLKTLPARVCVGMAEFEETLMHRCAVYGNRNGFHNSTKYEPKLFLLHASVIGAPALDIGKHWIDLTRLLPVTLDELESEERSSGKWTTSFKLTGKAAGAMLNVSFGFSIMDDKAFESGYFVKVPSVEKEHGLTRADYIADFSNSSGANQLIDLCHVPTISTKALKRQSQSLGIKFPSEIFPCQGSELAQSLSLLYRKLEKEKMCNDASDFDFVHDYLVFPNLKTTPLLECAGGSAKHEVNDAALDLIENDKEICTKDQLKIERYGSQRFDSSLIEIIDTAEMFGEEITFDDSVECDSNLDADDHSEIEDMVHVENALSIKEPFAKELVFSDAASGSAKSGSFLVISKFYEKEKIMKTRSWNEENKLPGSLGLDDDAESIENDFLNMLCANPSQDDMFLDRPKDLLWRQLDKDSLRWRNDCHDDLDVSSTVLNHISVNESLMIKRKAKSIENLETEALMHEWGLNEKAFQNSPCASSGGFGSPVYLPPEEPLKLPSLGEGLGPIIQTKDGGFLRTMSPLLFRNVDSGSRLVVQVSAPVILPLTMGMTAMDILQRWASRGIKKMSIHVNELMPLEDITGKTIYQMVLDTELVTSEVFKRWALHPKASTDVKKVDASAPNSSMLHSSPVSEEIDSDCVSFENLVPLAINNVEGLLIEGLKIQSGMSDQEAPSRIAINFAGSPAAGETTEHCENFDAESATNMKVLNLDEILHCSVPLQEWLRRETKDSCSKMSCGRKIMDHESGKSSGGNDFGLKNKFIMGLKVQLRDPLRDNETVGSSMLALIEVEKVCFTCQLGTGACHDETAGLDERWVLEQGKSIHENDIPLFRVSSVHLAGVHAVLDSEELWGTNKQQQAGSRWLLSSGMLRSRKKHMANLNAVVKFSSMGTRDVCWSISSCTHGESTVWNEMTSLNVHVRNPNIIFPLESSMNRIQVLV